MNCTSPVFGQYPCGKCINCRAKSRQEWVFRLRMEYQASDFGLFVTLTYDDEHLPPDGVNIRDVQLFLKRLRKHWKSQTLRYYICSEYGDHTQRPHYHALLFFNGIERTSSLYDIITDSWQNGMCDYGEIEEGSIVYCTKYCLKGSDVPRGKNKNFRMLSKMHGGIGADYIERQADYHLRQLDKPMAVKWQGQTAPMPRYYRTKLLSNFGDDEKELIRRMYAEFCTRKEIEAYNKGCRAYCRRHPEAEVLVDIRTRYGKLLCPAYDKYLEQKQQIKESLINNRTKKQRL